MSKVEDWLTPELESSFDLLINESLKPKTITKDKFDRHILPFILTKSDKEKYKDGIDIKIIADYAGPYRGLSVTDNQGNELFQLPPIIAQLPIRIYEINGHRINLDAIIIDYMARKESGEGNSADEWFISIAGLDADAKDIESLREQLEFLSMWVKFYNIYNLDISNLLPSLKGVNKQNIQTSTTSVEYDQFEDL